MITALEHYNQVYNHQIVQRNLGHLTPVKAIKQWYKKKPEIFKKRVYDQTDLDSMGWHSDAEIDLIKNGVIASLSLGAARKFSLRHKENKQSISVELGHGSLLVMKGTTQTYWQHSLPKTTRVKDYRINLTFRQIRG